MRIVFNLMNHFNPISGGLNVIISAMRHLKAANFHVCTYYYAFEQQQSINLGLEKEFQRLEFHELNPADDVVVVAEEFIWVAHDFLIPNNIRYVIFNQGLFASLVSYNPYNDHKKTYQQSLAVLVNSLHTSKGVEKLFDVKQNNIFYYRIGIDTNLYYPEPKENLASCLLYKNGPFVRFVNHYFKDKYPNWNITMIDHLPREETAAIFRKSKLFLSFGGPEGFGLPPLEAAFCGCKIVGFHGEAGKEYFMEPVFTSVNFMDHLDFIDKLDYVMSTIDNDNNKQYNEYVNYLKYFYSKNNEMISIVNFFVYIRDTFFKK